MSTEFLFANFWASYLEQELLAGATTLYVPAADAALLPAPTGVQRVALVLHDGVQQKEIVYVSANPLSGALTITRAREGTAANVWPAGTLVANVVTADALDNIIYDTTGLVLTDLSNVLDDTIEARMIPDGEITDVKISSLDGAKLVAESVPAAAMADDSIPTRAVQNGAITLDKHAAASVDNSKLVNATITSAKSAEGGWVPTGGIIAFGGGTAPAGWLLCEGQAVSRAQYPGLFSVISTNWGVGDGSTTFNVPDFRGVVPRGHDNGRGLDSGRVLYSYQADDYKAHLHTVARLDGAGGSNGLQYAASSASAGTENTSTMPATGGAETRMKNVACKFIIRIGPGDPVS